MPEGLHPRQARAASSTGRVGLELRVELEVIFALGLVRRGEEALVSPRVLWGRLELAWQGLMLLHGRRLVVGDLRGHLRQGLTGHLLLHGLLRLAALHHLHVLLIGLHLLHGLPLGTLLEQHVLLPLAVLVDLLLTFGRDLHVRVLVQEIGQLVICQRLIVVDVNTVLLLLRLLVLWLRVLLLLKVHHWLLKSGLLLLGHRLLLLLLGWQWLVLDLGLVVVLLLVRHRLRGRHRLLSLDVALVFTALLICVFALLFLDVLLDALAHVLLEFTTLSH